MEKAAIPFKGAATALITPMNDDLSVDFDSLGKLIDFQTDAGINAILILGTTGEAPTLSDDEKRRITVYSAEKIRGRVPLIVGVGTNDTKRSADMARWASKNGADAVLAVTPYYNKATDDGLIRHFFTIADECEKPVILYNIPSRTGVKISLPVYEKLALHPNIAGVKEASGDISAIAGLISSVGGRFAVYSGNDAETVPVMALGGVGVFSVLSNIMPREVTAICSDMLCGRTRSAAGASAELLPLTSALFSEVNPIPVKTACGLLGMCTGALRPPLCGMGEASRQKLIKELKKKGLI